MEKSIVTGRVTIERVKFTGFAARGYTPNRRFAKDSSQRIYADLRKFADGYTPIRTRFTAISHHSPAQIREWTLYY